MEYVIIIAAIILLIVVEFLDETLDVLFWLMRLGKRTLDNRQKVATQAYWAEKEKQNRSNIAF
jgi:hypothetical protein